MVRTMDSFFDVAGWTLTVLIIAGYLFRKPLKLGPGWITPAVLAVALLTVLEPAHPYQGPYTGEEPTMKLGVFGGVHHDVYLGCLNCSARDADSMRSYDSPYGISPTAGTRGIFHAGSVYASRDSSLSACNPAASSPPVVLDENGRMVGSLDEDLSGAIIHDAPDAPFLVRVMACGDAP